MVNKKKFYSLHYRIQIGYLIQLRSFKKAIDYYAIATRNEILLFRKDLKNLLLLFNIFLRFK